MQCTSSDLDDWLKERDLLMKNDNIFSALSSV
jgi:hypothetical protein